jgi:hypothetical protein
MSSGIVTIKVSDAETYELPFDTFIIFPSFPVNNDVLKNPSLISTNNNQFKVEIKQAVHIPQYNAVFQIDNLPEDGTYNITYLGGELLINEIQYLPAFSNAPSIINESLYITIKNVIYLTDVNTGEIYGYFIISDGASLPGYSYIIFNSLSVKIQNLEDLGKVSINFNESPSNWQVTFISSTFYPPGTELSIFNISFIITTASKQTTNIYQYSAYLKVAVLESSALGHIDNTGAYKRVYDTDPYNWERLDDLTTAIQNIIPNRTNNTLQTPFEKSFDRFESTIQWNTNQIKNVVANLYNQSQVLIVPWYENDQLEWISVDDLKTKLVTTLDSTFDISQLNIIGKPRKIKLFARNKYKKAVTMYECPTITLTPDRELTDIQLDNGFYISASDGNEFPTTRFSYNYNIGYNSIMRFQFTDELPNDSSGMANVIEDKDDDGNPIQKYQYWYDNVNFTLDQSTTDDTLYDRTTDLIQMFLKGLIFTANPIITFDSTNDWLDSYFPYGISPWNFQVYLKPTNTGKWIPSPEPYPIYDINLISTLPPTVWTGAYGTVARINILQQSDEMIQKDIAQQGFYVNGFNVGATITPFSLLTIEQQTQMPIMAESTVKSYLNDLSQIPDDIMYKVYLISGIQKQLYQYGITLEDVVDKSESKDIVPSQILTIDCSGGSINVTLDGGDIQYNVQSINSVVDVINCYNTTNDKNGNVTEISLLSDFKISCVQIKPPKIRSEKVLILVMGTAIYVISLRVFQSPPFITLPYIYKIGEEFDQAITTDYNTIAVDGYTSLLTHVKQFIDKSIEFSWTGKQNDVLTWLPKLLPYRIVQFKDEKYVIINTTVSVDGDYITIKCTADNRIKFYEKWNMIVTDIEPSVCKFELYPRLPNNHYPTSKIYAFSDRVAKLKEYLQKVFEYTYTTAGDIEIDIIE